MPLESPWSVLRRLESVGEENFNDNAREWVRSFGDPVVESLILMAGAQEGPGWTVGVQERRARLRNMARNLVETGLRDAPDVWQPLLESGLQPDSERSLEMRLACLRLCATLGRLESASDAASYLLTQDQLAQDKLTQDSRDPGGSTASGASGPSRVSWSHRMLHREAQAALFALLGVRFENREEFQAFPRLPEDVQRRYSRAFAQAAEREYLLQERLLQAESQTAVDLLSSSDWRLRQAAALRLIGAVGAQSESVAHVRERLLKQVPEECHILVFHQLLQALSDLALAAGPESATMADLRATLESVVLDAPAPLAPALMSAFERLPQTGEAQSLEDWRLATTLLQSLFRPELRLDGDTTAQVLRSWSRITTQVSGLATDATLKRGIEQHILDFMVDPGEPERVRLAAAEALAHANISEAAVKRIAIVLRSPESSTHLRMVCYPLLLGTTSRLDWDTEDGQGLLRALLRDMQATDVNLASMSVALAKDPIILDRLISLEKERGTVLPAALAALESSPNSELRQTLLPLIKDLSASCARPDLLAQHVTNPAIGAWLVEEPTLARDLTPIYLQLSGPAQPGLILQAAQSWVHAEPGSLTVGTQALRLVMALAVDEAALLSGDEHLAIVRMALEQLLRLPRSESNHWAKSWAPRLLEVHLPAARAQVGDGLGTAENQTLPGHFDHLEALLLAQQQGEDWTPASRAFARALEANPGPSRERFLILRDRARFLDSLASAPGPQGSPNRNDGKTDWAELIEILSKAPRGGALTVLAATPAFEGLVPWLDFSDLASAALVARNENRSDVAAYLWQERSASPLWRALPSGVCLRDLENWAQCVLLAKDANLAANWLEFQTQNVTHAYLGSNGQPQAANENAWLEWEGPALIEWQNRLEEVRAAALQWNPGQQANQQEGQQ